MDRQQVAERLKWLAIEVELDRPNWKDVFQAAIDLAKESRALAGKQSGGKSVPERDA